MKKEISESARLAKEAAVLARQRLTNVCQHPPRQPEGRALPMMLGCTVPLWIHQFRQLSIEEWQTKINELNSDGAEFCLRMEYVLHRGPKEGDSARAFNDLAKSIALLSFCPGGIRCFNSHWESKFDNPTTDTGAQD